ncbi:MAG: phosphoribosylglycinamide formyltransferase [Gammaproteobacteria bacterium]|nr:phosphoribosylglycinamide formyltransferase [Gammaproteobacteria bacterium]
MTPMPIVVLISGSGSNLQAIMDACVSGKINARICAVISNKPGVYGLERAKEADIPTHCIDHTLFPDRDAFETKLSQCIDDYAPGLIVLAGFMRILGKAFIQRYQGRMLNIHPSLLPHFPGLNTHQRALDAKHRHHGCTVHFVTQELDGGPPVALSKLEVNPPETAESLASRVLVLEHKLYPTVISLFAEKRLYMEDNIAILDDEPLHAPIDITQIQTKKISQHL